MEKVNKKKRRTLVTLLMSKEEREMLTILTDYESTSNSEWIRRVIRKEAEELASKLRKKGKEIPKAIDF